MTPAAKYVQICLEPVQEKRRDLWRRHTVFGNLAMIRVASAGRVAQGPMVVLENCREKSKRGLLERAKAEKRPKMAV